jgi:hypothetical protein
MVGRGLRSPAVLAGLFTLLLATGALAVTHRAARPALPPPQAMRDARAAIPGIPQLRGLHYDRITTGAVDSRLVRVSFWHGAQIVAEVAVRADGTVAQGVGFARLGVPYGNWLAYQPALLALLALLFVLCTGVAPLRRLRNLDVAATLTLLAPAILLQHRLLAASVVAALPGLLYLAGRLLHAGLRDSVTPPRTVPLWDLVTSGWDPRRRVRILRLLVAMVALTFLMVGVSSPDAVDVIYAVTEGATSMLHGLLPYGHMPGDVIHGDTYPVLSYALYTPLALLAPVRSTWDSVDLALGATVLLALSLAAGIGWAAARSLHRGPAADGAAQREEAGLRAGLTWLSFPCVLITVSTGTTDLTLAVLLLIALLLWRRPAAATAMLGIAGWFKLAPFALLPLWLAPLRGRRLLAAVAALVAVSAAALGLVVALGGFAGVGEMLQAVGFQLTRGSPQSLWAVLGLESLHPLGQGLTLGLIAATSVRFWQRPELASRERLAALSGAILLLLQLSGEYWAFLYLVWVVPLLSLSLLAPSPVPAPAGETLRGPVVPALLPLPVGS